VSSSESTARRIARIREAGRSRGSLVLAPPDQALLVLAASGRRSMPAREIPEGLAQHLGLRSTGRHPSRSEYVRRGLIYIASSGTLALVTSVDVERELAALTRRLGIAESDGRQVELFPSLDPREEPGAAKPPARAPRSSPLPPRPAPARPASVAPKAGSPAKPRMAPPPALPPFRAREKARLGARGGAPLERRAAPVLKPPVPKPPLPPALPPIAQSDGLPPVSLFPDPADVLALLASAPAPIERARLCRDATRLASAEQFDELLSLPSLSGVTPHTWQIETVRRVLRQHRGRALLADEVGLGKTIEAIIAMREYQLRGMARRVLVLVPPALVAQWAEELRSKAGVEPSVASGVDPAGDFWHSDGVVLASHATARAARHADVIASLRWDLVIVDEAHRLKNRATALHKLVDSLKTRFLLFATATPVENDLEELYNLVTLLRPGQLGTRDEFRRRHVDRRDGASAKDAQALRGLLADVMIRNTRAASGIDLPPRFVSTVIVDPDPDERALYDAVLAEFPTLRGAWRMLANTLLLQAGSSPWAVRAALARALERGDPALVEALAHIPRVDAPGAKVRALLEIVAAHREKVLVFTKYRESLRAIEDAATAARIPVASVHGELSRDGKTDAIARFREGVPILASTDVGSEGHNLQFASVVVNFDLPWNPMVVEQRIGRVHRYGQTNEVRVYNLAARGTIEERLLDVLDRRIHLFELVVGEMDMVLGNVVDQRDLEERLLDLYERTRQEREIDDEFDRIAAELAAARGQYDRVKLLDEQLFGRELEA
jgi:superfamily II DNA or RNA helicase